jgi:hypothetical protein
MPKIFGALLFLSLILSACSIGRSTPPAEPPTLTTSASTVSTEVSTPQPSNQQDCAYQWAQKGLPELSSSFQQAIQAIGPEAQANAFAFGENCVHADGTVTFGAMETDFNVTFQVSDVGNESNLGELTMDVMKIIDEIPSDQIMGPRPGRVTIVFQSGAAQQNVVFYIDQYHNLPSNLSPLQIFTQLKTP